MFRDFPIKSSNFAVFPLNNVLDSQPMGQASQCIVLTLPIHWDTTVNINQLSPNALAYLGDAVFELWIRTTYLFPPKRISTYHHQVVSQVRAESQADCLNTLTPYLTDSEKEVVRRGRNAVTKTPKRLSPELYQAATSLETLIGYLYLKNPQRLNQLLQKIDLEINLG